MNRFFIITNDWKDPEHAVTRRVEAYLHEQGCVCVCEDLSAFRAGRGNKAWSGRSVPKDTDVCVALGGDGTMLEAARFTQEYDIPLLGVNLGNVGYLTEVEAQYAEGALSQIIADNYTIEPRMMLEGTTSDGRKRLALNDIVIARYGSISMLHLDVAINDTPLTSYSADGVIIATPTGSTGYSLSVGGPIVKPTAELMVMTPIAPHAVNARSIVLSADDRVTIEIGKTHEDVEIDAEISFDAAETVRARPGDQIQATRANRATRIIRLNQVSFLDVLHKKLS